MLESSDAGENGVVREKEEWNFQTFISQYNAIADRRGGWHYEMNNDTEKLELKYQGRPYLTLAEFAEARFYLEQLS